MLFFFEFCNMELAAVIHVGIFLGRDKRQVRLFEADRDKKGLLFRREFIEQGDTGVVVIATIQTDIHDIGKNIVSSMLSASGFEVHDLGVNVPIKTIIATAQEVDANIIALSALLTTTMPFMRDLIELLEAMGERQRFKVMVGGASVTPEFAESIGADGTTSNAVKAVQMAQQFIRQQRQERAGG